jgi:hypothetical protein
VEAAESAAEAVRMGTFRAAAAMREARNFMMDTRQSQWYFEIHVKKEG